MECPSCKADIPAGKRFCIKCGTALPVPCPACGSPNPPGAQFCGDCGAKLTAPSFATRREAPREPPVSPSASSAERRQLTVVFCDLVGSAALAARLDVEDLREVIGAYHRRVAETVAYFEGFVAKYMGDGVLVYFGYPQAHEDDAERAVRAGLALVDAVGQLPVATERLQIRVGIGTGTVVVGDLIGSGEAQERGVVGETPNLAARLQTIAEPGAVVIGQTTRRLIGNLFEVRDLGMIEAKGFPAPVRAYRVLRASAVESRFEALHATATLTALVGREEEIELLLRRWEQAKSSSGRVMLVSGEPGIGKSRLTAAFQERIANEPHTRLRYFCLPHHQDSALHPIIVQLERAAGFEREDASEVKLDKLEALLAPTAAPHEDMAFLAELLSIPVINHRYGQPLDLTPERRKEKTFAALLRQLEVLTRRQPVLMIFEDAHWSDPTSRELFDHVVERGRGWPVLLLITFRPEYATAWVGQAHVTALTLNRLDRGEGMALVQRIAGKKELPKDIVAEIVERTDGVPLFIEEITKAVLERGVSDDGGAGMIAGAPHPALAVPATLHASLMARLDRLGPAAKEIAQMGAVIGREFSYELLAAVAQHSGSDAAGLQIGLDRLADAGLLFRRGTPPQATFLFKHALVQDAAYGTLLRPKRQDLHARVARALEEWFPETVQTQPEVLAHHCAQAGAADEAVAYWGQAARLAIRRSATLEAQSHLTRALGLLSTLRPTPERCRLELDLQLALGGTLIATRDWTARETGAAFARARELCEQLGDTAQLHAAAWGQMMFHISRAELRRSDELSQEALDLAQRTSDAAARMMGHRAVGITAVHLGRLDAAREHLERAIGYYDPVRHRHLAFPYAYDPLISAKAILASFTLTALGYPDQALRTINEAIAHAEALSHRPSTAFALLHACHCHFLRRDRRLLRDRAAALIAECSRQGFPVWLAVSNIYAGWSKVEGGDTEIGLKQLRDGLAGWQAAGAALLLPTYLVVLARACLVSGEPSDALAAVTEALARIEQSGERLFEAEVHRCHGDVLLAQGDQNAAEAEASYGRAVDIARGQSARLWELRAATGLARLWRDQGKRKEARALLAQVYGWFTEGFDTPDLQEAKALLDELRR